MPKRWVNFQKTSPFTSYTWDKNLTWCNHIFHESDWPDSILSGWIQTGIGSGPDPLPPRVFPERIKTLWSVRVWLARLRELLLLVALACTFRQYHCMHHAWSPSNINRFNITTINSYWQRWFMLIDLRLWHWVEPCLSCTRHTRYNIMHYPPNHTVTVAELLGHL